MSKSLKWLCFLASVHHQLSIVFSGTMSSRLLSFFGSLESPFSCDLKWNTHITNTCTKARQHLCLLYHLFGMADPVSLTHLYKCLILPTLDCCSVVWDPAAVHIINKLEFVQILAARLTTSTGRPHLATFLPPWTGPPCELGERSKSSWSMLA